jgi:hypothetical protein
MNEWMNESWSVLITNKDDETKKVRLKPTKYMLRKVKLSTYLSKLMKIEDCLLQSFIASFGGVFPKVGCEVGKTKAMWYSFDSS